MKSRSWVSEVFAWQPATVAHSAGGSTPDSTNILLSSGDSNRTIRAGRRRPTGPSSGPRERAEAPRRDRPTQSGGYTPQAPTSGGFTGGGGGSFGSSGGSSGSSGGGLPFGGGGGGGGLPFGGGGGLRLPPIVLIIGGILLCLCLGFLVISGGLGSLLGSSSGPVVQDSIDQPAINDATDLVDQTAQDAPIEQGQPAFGQYLAQDALPVQQAAIPTNNAAAIDTSSVKQGQTWTFLLYMDADDKILEQDIFVDINETELVGSTDRVNIVAQLDRYRGGFAGDGDWTGARRYYITRDNDLSRISSKVVQDLGEVNMSNPDTLIDFAAWGIENYPADKYVLIMSDHGMGWPGGWSDPDRGGSGQVVTRAPLGSALGNHMYLEFVDYAFNEIQKRSGLDKFEIIGMDACLMGHIEVLSALQPYARYAIVSQETEPALGWAYTNFLGELVNNPDVTGAQLGQTIVKGYISADQRILNNQARTEWVGRSGVTTTQLTNQLEQNITLTTADLSAVPALVDSLNTLAVRLQQADQRAVAKARNYAQSFTSVFGSVPPSYIDLGNFVGLIKQATNDANVNAAADNTLAALSKVVLITKRGPNKPGANGVSIYFPNSQLFSNPATGLQSYNIVAGRFAQASLWDEFLTYHYTGRGFEAKTGQATLPDAGALVRAPGGGGITLTPITASNNSVSIGETVLLSTQISGDNVGYIMFFTGYLDKESNSIFVADQDYMESSNTREVNGVYYPDWGQGSFTLEFEWEPLMFAISDGDTDATAALMPMSYGRRPEEAVYTVDGTYTFNDGETRSARLFFQNGVMRQVFGFTGDNSQGSPAEISPKQGETFTVLQRWLDLGADNTITPATQEGETLTFGTQPFIWKELDAAAGDYVVGFIVSDLDGNSKAVYTQVTVN